MTPAEFCALRESWNGQHGATKAAQRINRRKGQNLKAFRCCDCGRWHIGKEGKSPGSLRRRRPSWEE